MVASVERHTRERILQIAEAFLGECGYHGTSLNHVAERVGIQKASLFHYFPSKEHLYRAVIEESFGETEQMVRLALEGEGAPLEKLCTLIGAYVDMVAAHPERTKILLRQSLGDAPGGAPPTDDSERLVAVVVKFVADGQRTRVFAPIDPVALVLSVVALVAFFFTSGPMLAPAWFGEPWGPATVERVKRHVTDVVQRCLTVHQAAAPRFAVACA